MYRAIEWKVFERGGPLLETAGEGPAVQERPEEPEIDEEKKEDIKDVEI